MTGSLRLEPRWSWEFPPPDDLAGLEPTETSEHNNSQVSQVCSGNTEREILPWLVLVSQPGAEDLEAIVDDVKRLVLGGGEGGGPSSRVRVTCQGSTRSCQTIISCWRHFQKEAMILVLR